MVDAFELGGVIFEARKLEAWGKEWAAIMIARDPYPRHVGADRSAEHDLCIAAAKAILARYTVGSKAADENPIWTDEDFVKARPGNEVLPAAVLARGNCEKVNGFCMRCGYRKCMAAAPPPPPLDRHAIGKKGGI